MKIKIIGAGYVGIANACLFAKDHDVTLVDIDVDKIEMIRNKTLYFYDELIQQSLKEINLNIEHTSISHYKDTELVIISTPTDYDEITHGFNSDSVESSIQSVLVDGFQGWIMIKSTIPVGFTEMMKLKYDYSKIFFSPEFLREGFALQDNLYPSRMIFGDTEEKVGMISKIYQMQAKKECPILFMDSTHAEAIKLFSNTYLALRIAFFNELDSYAEIKGLKSNLLIQGIGLDPRIGKHYNNPSFGYGGYCLPKDSKQLLSHYDSIPQNIISAIVYANQTRKLFILDHILEHAHQRIGIYRLSMKKKSDNFRNSAIVDILELARHHHLDIIIYEPQIETDSYMHYPVIHDLNTFKQESEWIVANRWDDEIKDVKEKVYTRDCFENDL